jgi:arylformamidase
LKLIDISVPIRSGMIVFEGDPAVRVERVQTIAAGAICDLTHLDLGAHTGTHVDAPAHFIDGAPGVDALDPGALIGAAHVVDATRIDRHIDATLLASLDVPPDAERVLFKTPNSRLWRGPAFSREFFGIAPDAARGLAARGVRLVGIDYLSVAPFGDPAPTHRALLEAGAVILEGLDLSAVEPGEWQLICLPLLIPGADGAPARAFLSRD